MSQRFPWKPPARPSRWFAREKVSAQGSQPSADAPAQARLCDSARQALRGTDGINYSRNADTLKIHLSLKKRTALGIWSKSPCRWYEAMCRCWNDWSLGNSVAGEWLNVRTTDALMGFLTPLLTLVQGAGKCRSGQSSLTSESKLNPSLSSNPEENF